MIEGTALFRLDHLNHFNHFVYAEIDADNEPGQIAGVCTGYPRGPIIHSLTGDHPRRPQASELAARSTQR